MMGRSNHFVRLMLAAGLSAVLVEPANAGTAEMLQQWGLLGAWSLDCALPADHNRGAVLSYEAVAGGKVMHRRDFGDSRDDAEVLSAEIARDGTLNLRVFFPMIRQTRDYGMVRMSDSSIRAIYNRDEKGQYSIRDGKVVTTGKPTPVQHRCDRPGERG